MDVSIIIPTKNAGKLFKQVLEKIFSQETNLTYEVICIDSGSGDETIDIICQFPVKLFKILPSEFGHGKTRNFGASKGSGEFIIFLTQDALPINNLWLNNFIEAMKIDDEIVGGFGKHLPYPECNLFDKRDITMHFQNFGNNNTIFYIDDHKRYEKEEGYRHLLSFFSDNNSCIRRSTWEKIPYEDVEFAEDQIWAKKIIEMGYKKVYCPNAAVYHSHNYPLFTYFKRYYDEYKGLYEIHNYKVCENKTKIFMLTSWMLYNDFKYVINLKSINIFKKTYWIYYSLVRNYLRFRAGYLAAYYFNCSIDEKNSMDKRYSQQLMQRK